MRARVIVALFSSLALLAFTQVASACHFRDACNVLAKCLKDGVTNDIARIRNGAKEDNGQMVWAGGDACWNNFQRTNQAEYSTWQDATAACDPENFVTAANMAIDHNCRDYP